MVDYKNLAKILSGLSAVIGVTLLMPAVHSAIRGGPHTLMIFSVSGAAIILGLIGWLFYHEYKREVNHRTGFAIVALSWMTASLIGALPYYFSETLPTFLDSLFESTSGFSGTGASVLNSIEGTDKSILLWRSMTQWLGGMGIIVFFIAILPILGIGGVQLFRAESTGVSKDKITPRVRDTAQNLWKLYVGFTIILTAILVACGMSVYDGLNHAMTTMSTGGFSTKNSGVFAFESAAIDFWISTFMVIGSIGFAVYYRILSKRDFSVLKDTEFKGYIALLGLNILAISYINWGTAYESFWESLRFTYFTVAATASSTGFTNADYMVWPVFTHYLILMMMIVGGSSGSTAGGLKCIRAVAALKLLSKELKQVVHPQAVIPVCINGKPVQSSVASSIWGFVFIYFLVFSIVSGVLVYEGLDILSATTGVISALSNIGPALGSLGPYDNYAALSDLSKGVLCLAMLMGRLEFITVMVLFTPEFWRR